jgi:hypothetical protein
MTLNRIDHAGLAGRQALERFQETSRQDRPRPGSAGADAAPDAARPEQSDRAEISETARRLMEIRKDVDVGREALDNLPEVRDARVAEAKERLARGYYHSAAVTEDVAAKVGRTIEAIDEL